MPSTTATLACRPAGPDDAAEIARIYFFAASSAFSLSRTANASAT